MASKQRSSFVSATGLYPLWAGLASPEQAKRMLKILQASLEEKGGVAGSSELSRGPIQPQTRPQRQWDFPNGWAPHQVLVWEGLLRYGFREDAHRLIHHWLGMIARNARDYGGTVTEKYDVEKASHQVFAEYGNQGSNFSYITKEGFGWTNASYRIGYDFSAALSEKNCGMSSAPAATKKFLPKEDAFGPYPLARLGPLALRRNIAKSPGPRYFH